MRKYGKWVLTLGLLAATPGLTLAAGAKSKTDDKPTVASKEENQKLANDVAKAMRSKRIQGDISIEVKNGIAILSGTVADPRIKDRATDAVSQVRGIAHVDNRLRAGQPKAAADSARGVVSANHTAAPAKANRVQQVNNEIPAPAPTSNQEIAEQIAAGLTAASLDGYDIQIRFQNGVCLLDGSVGTQAERATAQQVVGSVPGVRSVANRLACADEPVQQRAPQGQYAPGAQYRQQYGPQGPQGPGPQGPQGGQYAQYPQGGPQQAGMYPVNYRQGEPGAPGGGPGAGGPPLGAMPMAPGGQMPPMPPTYGHPGMGASQAAYSNPSVPDYAWPAYAQYPNSAAVNYPTQYSASAFPYIGPFYPYPQVPLGWRDATLRWDDGQWNLMFRTRTDKWWWYFNPNNW